MYLFTLFRNILFIYFNLSGYMKYLFLFIAMSQNTPLVSSTSQTVSPGTIFYQHSPDPHQQHQSPVKYPENGHDTLSDFVTFVCQEAENGPQNAQVRTLVLLKHMFKIKSTREVKNI